MMHRSVFLAVVLAVSGFTGRASVQAEGGQAAQEIVHDVRWGDTLAGLARHYYGDGKKYGIIASANGIGDPHRIICGQRLRIPSAPAHAEKDDEAGRRDTLVAFAGTTTVVAASIPAPVPLALPEPAPAAENPLINPAEQTAVPEVVPFTWRQEKCTAFGEREKLSFSVRWQFVKVGSAVMEIQGFDEVNGRKAYHIYTEARSAAFFDAFYRVRDTNESWIDAESLCSLKFASRISESNSKREETLIFDHEKREFRIEENGKSGPIPHWVQDVLSSLYYLRNKDLAQGSEHMIDAHSGDKSWPLLVRVVGREKIRVPAGEFETIIVEPAIREGAGIFQAKGKLQVWMTADDRKIPVLMRSKIAVGAIEAVLTGIER